jgi:membrane-bound serine protease (ClpP class)
MKTKRFLFFIFFILFPWKPYSQGIPHHEAYLLEIDGAIGPATSEYFHRGLKKAQESNAELVILRMDTPGGLDTSMREIIKDILASRVPVVSYVSPGGARAASAGTYILYASHVAAMAPATNLGAATPVSIGGLPMPGKSPEKTEDKKEKSEGETDTLSRKATNDAKAYIRSLAEMRGRNVEWAEQAVEKAESLSAEEALSRGVIDLIASDVNDLLVKLNGRTVKVLDQEKILKTVGITIQEIKPTWLNRLLAVISNPNIAYILLIVGIYGLIFEFSSPGHVLPGVTGAICLLLAFYALHVLPVNYAGVALILFGIALMIVEVFVASFGAIGVGGVISFIIGSAILMDTQEPQFRIAWSLIASFGLVSALFFMVVIGLVIKARRRPIVSGAEELIGSIGEVLDDFETRGRIFLHSEIWDAETQIPLKKGQKVKVTRRKGLVLIVDKVGPN